MESLSSSWQHITRSWQSRAHAQLLWTPRVRLEWTSQAAVLLSQRKQVQCMSWLCLELLPHASACVGHQGTPVGPLCNAVVPLKNAAVHIASKRRSK